MQAVKHIFAVSFIAAIVYSLITVGIEYGRRSKKCVCEQSANQGCTIFELKSDKEVNYTVLVRGGAGGGRPDGIQGPAGAGVNFKPPKLTPQEEYEQKSAGWCLFYGDTWDSVNKICIPKGEEKEGQLYIQQIERFE